MSSFMSMIVYEMGVLCVSCIIAVIVACVIACLCLRCVNVLSWIWRYTENEEEITDEQKKKRGK